MNHDYNNLACNLLCNHLSICGILFFVTSNDVIPMRKYPTSLTICFSPISCPKIVSIFFSIIFDDPIVKSVISKTNIINIILNS